MRDLGFPQADPENDIFPYFEGVFIPRLEDLVDIPWCEQHQRLSDGSWCAYSSFQVPAPHYGEGAMKFVKGRGDTLREALENLFIEVMTNYKEYATRGE